MRRLTAFLVSGLAVGIVLSSLFAPAMIAWYFEPPVEVGINCRPAVDWALRRFIWFQGGGAVLGMILGFVAYHQTRRNPDKVTK